MKALKGSAYVGASMIDAQNSPMDHFMYYDARFQCTFNGLFDDYSQQPLKPYYAMKAFDALYSLGVSTAAESDTPDVYTISAKSGDGSEAAIMITYYKDHDSVNGEGAEDEALPLTVHWDGFAGERGVDVTYSVLDGDHDLVPVSGESFAGGSGWHTFTMPLYGTILIQLKKR